MSSNKLNEAIELRKSGKTQKAMQILTDLLQMHPEDATINYQAAWTCDSMGDEAAAVPYYEKAIANGLAGEERRGAMLGLGSTYRCLGEYEKSLAVFDRAVQEFPQERSLKVFRALTLYNLGKAEDAVGELLVQLLDTSSDSSIRTYEKALRFYSNKLNQTWK